MHSLRVSQETKYAVMNREMPKDICEVLKEINDLEKVVSHTLLKKEEELTHLSKDRQDYRNTFAYVSEWLQRAEHHFQERVMSIPEARVKHQVSADALKYAGVNQYWEKTHQTLG